MNDKRWVVLLFVAVLVFPGVVQAASFLENVRDFFLELCTALVYCFALLGGGFWLVVAMISRHSGETERYRNAIDKFKWAVGSLFGWMIFRAVVFEYNLFGKLFETMSNTFN